MAQATATKKTTTKMVRIKLPKGKLEQDKAPVKVIENGKMYTIPRGVYVEVPETVALELENKAAQEESLDAMNAELEANQG